MRSASLVLAPLLLVTVACGSSDDSSSEPEGTAGTAGGGAAGAGTAGSGAGGSGTGGVGGDGWQTLMEGDWSIEGGTESYVCVRRTMEEDVYVQEIEPINPLGTHHTVLTIGPPGKPDGVEDCEVFTNARDMLFGSGVGTNSLKFPEGVAVRLKAGQQLLLNLHLFNASNETLSGTSGTRIRTIAASEVEHEAEAILMGTFGLFLPPMKETIASGDCVQNGDVTLFGVMPHMHQLGTHMKVTARSSKQGDVVVHDEPYDFDQQIVSTFDFVEMADGDRVSVECTYVNTTPNLVTWGDSSLQEMCFAGIYRFPPRGTQGLACADE